jgi:amidohydrolase
MDLVQKVIDLSNKYEDEVIYIRREIHKNPELAFEEWKTSQLIFDRLSGLGFEITRDLAGTGILAILKGENEGKVLLLRADMDALPINEKVDIEFKSKVEGVMHACGHDVHIANLIGVAKILRELKDEFNGTIKFLFQPGEEKGGGGKKIVGLGVLDNPKVNGAIALHIMPIKEGKILIPKDIATANSDGFTIKIYGRQAHTSKPEQGIDAINIAAHIVVALNSILAKNIDPFDVATFSIGRIKGGRANNIVSDYAQLNGMIRSLSPKARLTIIERIEEISKGIANSFGGKCEFELRPGYPSVVNDKKLTDKITMNLKKHYRRLIQDIDPTIYVEEDLEKYIIGDSKPLMNAEDFGFISSQVPSTYYMVGTGDYAPNHSSKFFVDEKYIKLCTRTMTLAALEFLRD